MNFIDEFCSWILALNFGIEPIPTPHVKISLNPYLERMALSF
jgi:hypothetical protein